ncbi:hypothetical protein [Streptomyces sp. NPDC004783]|uniref:hypothetical protein n=1 Tax=Streptomyces sp. NPDC004783 TaxID=3154459 RepID=UPI0033BF0EC4
MTAPTLHTPKPRIDYPRPPLVHDHGRLFREPIYTDGQPYTEGDDLEDDDTPT